MDIKQNTILPSVLEIAHNIAQNTQRKYNSSYDYDTRGYFLKYGSFLPQGIESNNGHLTDEFKKVNHPTQSVESKYYTGTYPAVDWNKEPYRTLGFPSTSPLRIKMQGINYKGYSLFESIL